MALPGNGVTKQIILYIATAALGYALAGIRETVLASYRLDQVEKHTALLEKKLDTETVSKEMFMIYMDGLRVQIENLDKKIDESQGRK